MANPPPWPLDGQLHVIHMSLRPSHYRVKEQAKDKRSESWSDTHEVIRGERLSWFNLPSCRNWKWAMRMEVQRQHRDYEADSRVAGVMPCCFEKLITINMQIYESEKLHWESKEAKSEAKRNFSRLGRNRHVSHKESRQFPMNLSVIRHGAP